MMKQRARRLSMTIAASVMLTLLLAGTVWAITIIVDGTREAAWGGGGSANDSNEVLITNDGVDMQTVEWTNDTTNFYFLFETWATTDWNRVPDRPYIWLCIDNDNNTTTGTTFPSVCPGSGYDRYVQISGPTPPSISVYDSTFTPIAATTSSAASGTITEISIDLAALGFSSSNCGSAPTALYMDGRTTDPDDNVLDASNMPVNCGPPTAITVAAVNTQPTSIMNTGITVAVAICMLVGINTAAFQILRKRRKA